MKKEGKQPRIVFWSFVQLGGILTGLIQSLRGSGYAAAQRYHLSNQSYRKNAVGWAGSGCVSGCMGFIRQHDCGWIVAPGSPDVFAETVTSILQNPSMLRAKRELGMDSGKAHLSDDSKIIR